eukprot:10544414-Alexandrium_andersonii.AAC.1
MASDVRSSNCASAGTISALAPELQRDGRCVAPFCALSPMVAMGRAPGGRKGPNEGWGGRGARTCPQRCWH